MKMGLLKHIISIYAKKKAKYVEYLLSHPVEVMDNTLNKIMTHQQQTVFGREYGFDLIRSSEEFSDRIPLSNYQTMKKYLEATYENPNGGILTKEPVFWYLTTSGSSGTPKHLPVTEALAKTYTKGSMQILLPFMNVNPDNPKVFDGKFVVFAAAAQTGEINGVPLGYATGAFSRRAIGILKRLMVPGEDVFNMSDMEEKMRAYAQVMATENITAIQGITTLSLALVRRMQNEYGPWLLDKLKGTEHEKRLREAMRDDGNIEVSELWPSLRLFFCGGIDTDPYREWIGNTLPNTTIWEAYGGTEGVYGGQTMNEPGIQLFPNTNFLEFIPEKESGKPNPTVIPLSDVKKGFRYEMIITNIGGYYRYRLGDMMTFTSTNPYTIRMIGRTGKISNLCGEKLSDAHVSKAITTACLKTGAELMDFTAVAHIENGIPHYTIAGLFRDENFNKIEFVDSFEDALKSSNGEFKAVRETKALGPTKLVRMISSFYENLVEESHIQAKPTTLTTDTSILAQCEALP
jgi:hypothetical protein